jgi:hypothetical protein
MIERRKAACLTLALMARVCLLLTASSANALSGMPKSPPIRRIRSAVRGWEIK